ncbi:MAG TPA: hypothetical protein VJ436_06760 [Anaerolineales bacterium]|nr:hypothetical protein [Anaerolineales bacterium]
MPDEKFDEKEREKSEEKSSEEKWQRDPLSAIVWAAILIWAGLVLLANNLGYLENLQSVFQRQSPFWFLGNLGVISLIFLGAGVIVLLEVLTRLLMPAYRQPVTGSIIFAIVLLGIGLGNLVSWQVVWPLILIGIGASIILRGFTRRR